MQILAFIVINHWFGPSLSLSLLLGAEQSGSKPAKHLSIFLSCCIEVDITIHTLKVKRV